MCCFCVLNAFTSRRTFQSHFNQILKAVVKKEKETKKEKTNSYTAELYMSKIKHAQTKNLNNREIDEGADSNFLAWTTDKAQSDR